MDKKKWYHDYIAPLIVGATLFILVAMIDSLLSPESTSDFFGKLSDCFWVSGALLAAMGVLSWVGSKGGYDTLAYGVKSLAGHFSKHIYEELPKTLYDYKVKRDEKGRHWNKAMLIVGLILILLGGLSLIGYYAF